MSVKTVEERCNKFLDFSHEAKMMIATYCGLNRPIILSEAEQLMLFGVVLVRGCVSIIVSTKGITTLTANHESVDVYEWNDLAMLIIKEVLHND